MSDTDATRARHDVVADVDEILEHVINGNMLSMPYDVYTELFDAVDGLGVKVEKLQAENAKLREMVRDMFRDFANADYQLKINCGKTFLAVTRYEPRLQELGVEL